MEYCASNKHTASTMGVFFGCSRCSVNTQHSLRSTDVIINQYAFCSTFINISIWHIAFVLFFLHLFK